MFKKLILFILALGLIVPGIGAGAETNRAGIISGKVVAELPKHMKNVVVYIKEISGKLPSPQKHAVLDQKNLEFAPHVLPILRGTTVDFVNSDPKKHNVFTPDYEEYDLGSWPQGTVRSYVFDFRLTKSEQRKLDKLKAELAESSGERKKELEKKLEEFQARLEEKQKEPRVYTQLCNVHQEMEGFIIVLPNPYFSLTDTQGEFKIENIPPGKYTLKTWSEYRRIKPREIEVEVKSEKVAQVEFNFK